MKVCFDIVVKDFKVDLEVLVWVFVVLCELE